MGEILILPNHQREIDELIVQQQQMLAEAIPLTTHDHRSVDLTEVNHSQDEWTRCMLVTCEVLQRGLKKQIGIPDHQEGAIPCVMSTDHYDRVLKRLKYEQFDAHKRAVAKKAEEEHILKAITLEPLIQNWPSPGIWSF